MLKYLGRLCEVNNYFISSLRCDGHERTIILLSTSHLFSNFTSSNGNEMFIFPSYGAEGGSGHIGSFTQTGHWSSVGDKK